MNAFVSRVGGLLLMIASLCCTPVEAGDSDRPASAGRDGSLVICGGGPMAEGVLDHFVQLTGAEAGYLVVIPTAGSDSTAEDVARLTERWTSRGLGEVVVLHTRDREVADSMEFVEPLKSATGVWIGGGKQSQLAQSYVGTATETEILNVFDRGGVIGGTSAGAAIQSRVMIQSGNPIPVVRQGLDLLPDAIIDQHFLRRNRFNRLLSAVDQHPGKLGIGIDEGTAIVYRNGTCKVWGESYVTVIKQNRDTRQNAISTFRAGQEFPLYQGLRPQ